MDFKTGEIKLQRGNFTEADPYEDHMHDLERLCKQTMTHDDTALLMNDSGGGAWLGCSWDYSEDPTLLCRMQSVSPVLVSALFQSVVEIYS